MDINQRIMQMAMKQDYFFHAFISKTLCLKSEKCFGGKLCNERLTDFLCGFMTLEMHVPLVIGKAPFGM
jgi:hypothetical protein